MPTDATEKSAAKRFPENVAVGERRVAEEQKGE